jgi:hypothetical protein
VCPQEIKGWRDLYIVSIIVYVKLINFRIDEKMASKIDEIASKTLMTRSEVIRNAIAVYVSLLENIGFYFKPSPSIMPRNIDVYEERNAINVDLGNLTSITVLSVSYGGVGEKKLDTNFNLDFVAEVMANQVLVESICRFVSPLAALISTANDLEYSLGFLKKFKKAISRRENLRVVLASFEEFFETNQSGFTCTLIGLRDMSVKNIPKRGDSIFMFGRAVNSDELKAENLIGIDEVRRLANLVRRGEASAIFPVKSGGLAEVANFAASLSGGRAYLREETPGCPASAVILTSENDLSRYGGREVGEIL